MYGLQKNLPEIKENIEKSAQKIGRKTEDITLVGVTKTISPNQIQEAFELGVRNFGENRVQEFISKYENFDKNTDYTWHMIGHLQTNKVKFIIDKVKMIHSLDNVRLAEEIDKRAKQSDIKMDVLIEINIANEDTKHGVSAQDARFFVEQIHHFSNISIKGLMCIAPIVENAEQNRIYFEKMHRLSVDIQSQNMHNVDMCFLSMGMSQDYQIAIEEGANIIRIGSSLFGYNT
ncbi:MAG: YggS family pyridoxal phosphate-dependent enzyme [Defluviitaleaceae bacterium]|nr:YggS family pyridoxal phosphate-dependent enzyme [Defluviitaleaceae bacterium]